MAKKKTNLRYNRNTMKWVDTDGNEAIHPRYSLKPGSLDSKAFMNSYLAAVRDGLSLNDFMKTNQAYDAKKVQAVFFARPPMKMKATSSVKMSQRHSTDLVFVPATDDPKRSLRTSLI